MRFDTVRDRDDDDDTDAMAIGSTRSVIRNRTSVLILTATKPLEARTTGRDMKIPYIFSWRCGDVNNRPLRLSEGYVEMSFIAENSSSNTCVSVIILIIPGSSHLRPSPTG